MNVYENFLRKMQEGAIREYRVDGLTASRML
jgi:hypothetical protein